MSSQDVSKAHQAGKKKLKSFASAARGQEKLVISQKAPIPLVSRRVRHDDPSQMGRKEEAALVSEGAKGTMQRSSRLSIWYSSIVNYGKNQQNVIEVKDKDHPEIINFGEKGNADLEKLQTVVEVKSESPKAKEERDGSPSPLVEV